MSIKYDDADDYIETNLPLEYEYKSAELKQDSKHSCKVLVKEIYSETDFLTWLEAYKLKTNTCWIGNNWKFKKGPTAKFAFGTLLVIYILMLN
jgi:hypothetical protein